MDSTEDQMDSSRVKMGIWFGGNNNKKKLDIAHINLHYRNSSVLLKKKKKKNPKLNSACWEPGKSLQNTPALYRKSDP